MVLGRMVAMSLFGLMVLSAPAWGDQALLVKGMEAQKAGRNVEALKLLNEYVDRFPQVNEARYYRALALTGLGRHKEALEDVDKALVDNPGNTNFLLAKGNILVALERRPEAILIFSHAMRCDPRTAEACKERGDCLAQEGQFIEALADLNRAARLAPRDPWVFNKRGMAWFCQGEYQKAVDDFTTAISMQPELALSYFFRGNIYRHHLGQQDKAIADYQAGCRLGSSLCCGELEKLGVKPANRSGPRSAKPSPSWLDRCGVVVNPTGLWR
jgi:tetratricopeptide (TPR) repeat protein